jgi:predicted ATPase/class 3 adenylate cyclase
LRSAIITVMSTSARASNAPPTAPPTGTVTFLFSDIEGSTRLLEQLGDRYAAVLRRHREAMRRAFAEHDGVERGTEGDSFFVAFGDAIGAVAAAGEGTRNLAGVDWPDGADVRVRIGLHTGEGRLVDGDYIGMDVHRAARIAAAGHGGQVLLSESTRILVERGLSEGVSLRDLGEHQLKDLPTPEHLYQLVIDGQPAEFPPLRSLARTVANLPAQLSTIVGRDADVAAVRALLGDSRLVTVTGPGGMGKTRLAQEVALEIVAGGGSDAVFIPLEALTDADLIPLEILRALRLDTAFAREPLDRLAEHFSARAILLVLDNLEQLRAAGLAVKALLDRVPTVKVLASSQAALHVGGEQEYALDTLPVPSGDLGGGDPAAITNSPSVRLFVERARAVRADFVLDSSNAAAVADICTRLDGLPLAIELAAALVKVLSPAVIRERIAGRLDALATRRDDLPARQRTLRATLAWSYDLLDEAEQRLFRRLAAFVGGAGLVEIEAIADVDPPLSDAIGSLETLVDRSLVRVRRGRSAEDRYGLFETMRTYGRELLRDSSEERDITRAHAAIYRDLAHRAEPALYAAERRAWLERLADDHDNLRAALDELEASGDLAGALDLAADLWRFWQQRGHVREGRDRLEHLLAIIAAPGATAIPAGIRSRAEEATGSLWYWSSTERRTVRDYYERAVAYAVESGDRSREAWARYNFAFAFDFTPAAGDVGPGDPAAAASLRTRALEIFRELGDRRGIGESLWAMGGNALAIASDPAVARARLLEAIPLLEEIGDLYGLGWAQISLGIQEALSGDFLAAGDQVGRAAEVFVRDGDVAGQIVSVQCLGSLAARRGDDLTAVRFGAAAEAAAREIGVDLPRIPPIVIPVDEARARLAPEDLERESELGVALGAKAILDTAIESWRASRPGAGGRVGAAP